MFSQNALIEFVRNTLPRSVQWLRSNLPEKQMLLFFNWNIWPSTSSISSVVETVCRHFTSGDAKYLLFFE